MFTRNKGQFKYLLILSMLLALFISANAFIDYKPPPQEVIKIENPVEKEIPQTFTILIWNIGYCGLGEEADFFMDGGEMSIAVNKETVEKHFKNVKKFLKSKDADIMLLQEVDEIAKRSHRVKQYIGLRDYFKNYSSGFAYNYKVPFVPVPLKKPMGKVKSGLMTFSKFKIVKLMRYQLPGNYSWPTRVFHLDRCILVSRIKMPKTQSEWVIINIHLSAFDKGGELRKQQLAFLKKFMIKEHKEGNYVIVGGDWNHSFPGFKNTFSNNKPDPSWLQYLPADWAPEGWEFKYDKDKPTIRANSTIYKRGDNFRTIIDGFLVSPNITIADVEGFDLDFVDSDHNPVILKVKIMIPDCKNINDIMKYDEQTVNLIGTYRVSEEKHDPKNRKKIFLGSYVELDDGTKVILGYLTPNISGEKYNGKKVKITGTIYSSTPPEGEYMQMVVAPHLNDYESIEIVE